MFTKTTTSFLFLIALLSCNPSQNATSPTLVERPNILFLFADDQTFQAVHALGNSVIETPNLDRLVNNGTTFTHAYNMGGWHGAICQASRTMLMSGQFLWPAQEVHRAYVEKDSVALAHTWGRVMDRNGYDTYMSGKWHVAAPADVVFDQAEHIRPGMPGDAWSNFWRTTGKNLNLSEGSSDLPDLKSIMPVGYHRPNDVNDTIWSPADTSFGGFWEGGKHWSEVLKDDGLEYIKTASQRENPFFMYLAFNAPHDPRQAPQSFVDKYPLENIPVPANWLPEYPWKDSIGCSPGLRDEALAPFPRTEFAIKTHMQEYYAIVTHLDEQVGKILDALEASGQADETYIFFSADHGLSVGQHGLIGKQSLYDHSMRVPLMISGPGIPKGKKVDTDVYLQDLMPTSLELAGIEKPDYVQFNSLLGMTQAEKVSEVPYPAVYGAYRDLQRMIRKDGYKLVVYPRINKLLLFDVNADPLEMENLADNPDQAERVKTLFSELLGLQESMEDPLNLQPLFAELYP